MAASTILSILADLLGIPLELDSRKSCSVSTPSGILRVLERPSFGTTLLVLEIGSIPRRQCQVIEPVLDKHTRQARSSTATLLLNPFTGDLSAWIEIPSVAEHEMLEGRLLQLFTFADCWRDELRRITSSEAHPMSPAAQACAMRDVSQRLVKLQTGI